MNTMCLVHDRRWVPTFQYFLTQCYSLIHLPRKYGYPLSQHVCTCGQAAPVPTMYFPLANDMQDAFNQVKIALHLWPEEQRTILQPLIHQLERYDQADTWFSLVKLVYYFMAMKQRKYDTLDPDAKLPGAGAQASGGAQSPVQPRPEIGSSLGGSSLGTSGPLHMSPLGQGLRNGGGASAPTPPSPGAAAMGVASAHRQPKLKKLSSAEWIDDCFFHGPRKKFAFQCVVNYLHRNGRLPVKLNIPFSLAVCCCSENIELKDLFKSESECEESCKFMKEKLELWRGDSKSTIAPYITLLDDYITNKNITGGFLKFVYHFQKAFKGDLVEINEIYEELKHHR